MEKICFVRISWEPFGRNLYFLKDLFEEVVLKRRVLFKDSEIFRN